MNLQRVLGHSILALGLYCGYVLVNGFANATVTLRDGYITTRFPFENGYAQATYWEEYRVNIWDGRPDGTPEKKYVEFYSPFGYEGIRTVVGIASPSGKENVQIQFMNGDACSEFPDEGPKCDTEQLDLGEWLLEQSVEKLEDALRYYEYPLTT